MKKYRLSNNRGKYVEGTLNVFIKLHTYIHTYICFQERKRHRKT